MTNRTDLIRVSRLAVLLAMLGMLLSTLPVSAASSVGIEARALMGGRYAVGGWMAVAVTLVNDGEPTDGNLTAATQAGAVSRFVEMPAGARKVVMLYLQPEAFQRKITVEFQEPNGTVRDEVEVRVLEQSDQQRAIVGDGGGTLRPQLLGTDELSGPEPISLAPADIPERPEPLGGLSAMVWAGDSASLTEAQQRSLERWVAEGGQLVILGGPDWQARTAAFAELLPVTGLAATDGVPQAALAAWSGSDAPATPDATVSTGTLHEDARALITADDGTVLASMRPVGAGHVVLIGTDLATDAHRGWAGAPLLWGRLLPSGALLEQFTGGGFPFQEESDSSLSQALTTLPSLDVPPAELLLAVIVGYILLIGPVSYIVLRRVDRRELAWVTAPLLIVLFSASSYGIGRSLKGSDVIVNQISLIRSSSAGGSASVETYAGVYSPDNATYDVSVEADALMGRLLPSALRDFGVPTGTDVLVEQGDPAHLRGLGIGAGGFEGVRAVAVIEHQPTLSISWGTRGDDRIGTVTNIGDVTISDVAWISTSGGEMVGDLEPGADADFTIPATNFNGSAASEQVYGFGGFDTGSDEQRQIQMRRQVIDALVGYGSGFRGFDIGTASARGPYLIGWRPGEGPLPILVDGQKAQRFGSEVEVIAARPPLGSGEVTIRPHQMAITVVGTEGDAVSGGPGMVMLGDGSVTYGIGLPLEAAGLAATDVEIVVGPDPSFVLTDQGGFGGFLPQGYTVEVRRPGTDEWVLVGDLNQRSRFEIDDPSTAITPTGRIEVRVTGRLDPNFGQPPSVFVSAQVTGVIGE
ncbi:MAG: hypothetical protein H0W10_01240 [Chloroflexi bacterium]|nr:hypothetical protein [Chloroflexota bacterium]